MEIDKADRQQELGHDKRNATSPLVKIAKVCLATVGAILLAAAGEAVWELVIKPYTPQILNVIVSASTLGIQSLDDKLYYDIAIGYYERNSIQIYMLTNGIILITPPLFMMTVLLRVSSGFKRRNRDIAAKTASSIPQTFYQALKTIKVQLYLFIISWILLCGIVFFSVASTVYEARAEANLRQLFTIDRPFMDEKDFYMLESEAARMKSKADYEIVIDHLRSVALSNKIDPPRLY